MPSFRRHLVAKNRSPATATNYGRTAHVFADHRQQSGMPTRVGAVTREHVEARVIGEPLPGGCSSSGAGAPGKARSPGHRMALIEPPAWASAPVPVLSDADLTALLAATTGKDFQQRRDHALIRVFIDTGERVQEVVGLSVDDVDLGAREVVRHRGYASLLRPPSRGPFRVFRLVVGRVKVVVATIGSSICR